MKKRMSRVCFTPNSTIRLYEYFMGRTSEDEIQKNMNLTSQLAQPNTKFSIFVVLLSDEKIFKKIFS